MNRSAPSVRAHRTGMAAAVAVAAVLAGASHAFAQLVGPSTVSTPYVLPAVPGIATISIITTDNTGATPDDAVPLTGGSPGQTYGLAGIPDGMGAFDNGDRTFTLVVNHEIPSGGDVRAHGVNGAFVSKWIINKDTLQVISGSDLMTQVIGWNSTTQASDATIPITAFSRFCSADLPAVSAFFNPATGLGTTARIFMHGEENSAAGFRQQATVITGADAGKSYTLGKFNLLTNGSGVNAVGSWENALANPLAQNKTVVIGNNDGGTGIMANALAVYVGTKQATGSEIDKAGLTNGVLSFISVTGNAAEIVNGTTRATNITNGTRFTLSANSSTTFSRPEDGAWNPANPNQYYFVTTDQLDQVSDGVGSQNGRSRLWRLTFDDITNPTAGGKVDILLDSPIVDGKRANMFDNMAVSPTDGKIYLEEDVGNAAHNGKVFEFDPASGLIRTILAHDTARFGDIGVAATSPFTQDEETSGIIDITSIMAGSALSNGLPGEKWLITSDQAHYFTGITTGQVEGGQIVVIHTPEPASIALLALGTGLLLARRRRS